MLLWKSLHTDSKEERELDAELTWYANSGASRIAERYVARSPGISGLLLPRYSSRYFALTVSIYNAMILLWGACRL